MIALMRRLEQCREHSRKIKNLSMKTRNKILRDLAEELIKDEKKILIENSKDLKKLDENATKAFRDRLSLDSKRIKAMSDSLKYVSKLPDPFVEEVEKRRLDNGLILSKVRSPLGIILMIFESRPNVTTEAFSLAFKSGNLIILRAGKEAAYTVSHIYKLIDKVAKKNKVSEKIFWGITDSDRAITDYLLKQNEIIDVVVPRGGDALIKHVTENSSIPIIKNDRGMCHTFVHEDSDIEMAISVVENAKVQRPGVCNSLETVLIHKKCAKAFLVELYEKLVRGGVTVFCCKDSYSSLKNICNAKKESQFLERIQLAEAKNWDTEYLDLKLNCKIVGSLNEAVVHIEKHGSRHSEAIITKSKISARAFQKQIDAAAVYWNASTRFTDGYQFGLGGELGISTQKLHVRGPVGLNDLTCFRWVVDGKGQIRN